MIIIQMFYSLKTFNTDFYFLFFSRYGLYRFIKILNFKTHFKNHRFIDAVERKTLLTQKYV